MASRPPKSSHVAVTETLTNKDVALSLVKSLLEGQQVLGTQVQSSTSPQDRNTAANTQAAYVVQLYASILRRLNLIEEQGNSQAPAVPK